MCRCPTRSRARQSPREFVEDYAGKGNCCIGTPGDAIAHIQDLLDTSGGFGTLLLLGHDWASPQATYHSYELFAREVMPHFRGQLSAPRASHDWAKGKRDQLLGRAGEAIVKAINEHTGDLNARAVMRASVLRAGRMVLRDDVAEPVPAPGQVLVGVKACGICGSDLHFAAHGEQMVRLTKEMTGLPIEGGLRVDLTQDVFMGHEFSAEVLEAGPDTDAPPPGTLVTSLPVLLSPKGFEPILSSNTTIGGYAERMLLSAPLLLRIPSGLDPRLASLTEPLAVGLHAVNKSSVQPGDVTLVIGCGPIGLSIIAALRRQGIEHIAASDFSPKRRELAATMGAHQVVDPGQGSPFDDVKPAVVFEAVGVPGIVNDVMRRAPMGTRLVVAGVCMESDPILPLFGIAKEISVQFVNAYDAAEFAESLRAIAEGEVDVAPLITAEVALSGVGAAFDDLANPDTHCKILVTPLRLAVIPLCAELHRCSAEFRRAPMRSAS